MQVCFIPVICFRSRADSMFHYLINMTDENYRGVEVRVALGQYLRVLKI